MIWRNAASGGLACFFIFCFSHTQGGGKGALDYGNPLHIQKSSGFFSPVGSDFQVNGLLSIQCGVLIAVMESLFSMYIVTVSKYGLLFRDGRTGLESNGIFSPSSASFFLSK